MTPPSPLTRRRFVGGAAALAATTAISPLAAPAVHAAQKASGAVGTVVDEQAFARLEVVGDGLWAVVSTPLDASGQFAYPETLCNGGLILGDKEVVAIDGFLQPSGAAWLSEQSLKITGKRPDKVIVTHFHLDHSGGLSGYQQGAEGPAILATDTTRKLMFANYAVGQPRENSPFLQPAGRIQMPTHILPDDTKELRLDIGGRTLRLQALKGHTPSDIAVHVSDADVLYAGDLIWQGLFPNCTHAIMSALETSCRTLFGAGDNLIVTGHGGLDRASRLEGPFMGLLAAVEKAARDGRAKGLDAVTASKALALPESVSDWGFFNDRYPELAMTAWYREWDAADNPG